VPGGHGTRDGPPVADAGACRFAGRGAAGRCRNQAAPIRLLPPNEAAESRGIEISGTALLSALGGWFRRITWEWWLPGWQGACPCLQEWFLGPQYEYVMNDFLHASGVSFIRFPDLRYCPGL
jgi:hypothetical protein